MKCEICEKKTERRSRWHWGGMALEICSGCREGLRKMEREGKRVDVWELVP